MTMNLVTLLQHMKWANQEIFTTISKLPHEALDAHVSKSEWHVAEILGHIVGAADRYASRLNGRESNEIKTPKSMRELKELTEKLAKYDSELINLSEIPNKNIEIKRDGEVTNWQASTILSQSIHHATEHRCQAVAALEFRGYKAPNLDDYDLWSFEYFLKGM